MRKIGFVRNRSTVTRASNIDIDRSIDGFENRFISTSSVIVRDCYFKRAVTTTTTTTTTTTKTKAYYLVSRSLSTRSVVVVVVVVVVVAYPLSLLVFISNKFTRARLRIDELLAH
jgi:hypothetical protein